MYVLLNGFSLLGLNPFWEVIMLGAVLIAIVGQEQQKHTVKFQSQQREKQPDFWAYSKIMRFQFRRIIMKRVKYGMIGFEE